MPELSEATLVPIRRAPAYPAYVRDWIAAAEKPGRRLQLYGALIFLAVGLRDIHLFGEDAWPALIVRFAMTGALVMIALIGRILPPAVIAWVGVLYLLVLSIGVGLTASLEPGQGVTHTLAAFVLLQMAIGPMWPTRTHFLVAAGVILVPAMVLLVWIQADHALWVDYLAYFGAAVAVSWLLFRVRERIAFEAFCMRQELLWQAYSDALTGVLNRAGWEAQGSRVVAEVEAAGGRLALLYMDIDHFKQINDRPGHAAGDEVIELTAAAIRACLRGNDRVARLGGEEFGVLLPGADARIAARVAARIRERLAKLRPEPVSLTIGVAEMQPGETLEALMERADQAMLGGKRDGRDRVVVA